MADELGAASVLVRVFGVVGSEREGVLVILLVQQPAVKRRLLKQKVLVVSFPCVRPEPVLVKRSLLV